VANRARAAFRAWLDAWAEFEALNALASYAYENPENTFPEFSTEGARFERRAWDTRCFRAHPASGTTSNSTGSRDSTS